MAENQNPNGNTILQALLDLQTQGLGMLTIDDAVKTIHDDDNLQKTLQVYWDKHAYPNKALVYAQVGIEQAFYTLSDTAFKVINLLGMYAHPGGYIQAKTADICAVTRMSRNTVRDAINDLLECGAMIIAVPAVHHSAPIYRVNPALLHKGSRRDVSIRDFVASLDINPNQYILARQFDLVIQTDVVRTEDLVYSKLYLETPEEVAKKRGRKKSKTKKSTIMPGQMTLEKDFPEFLPGDQKTE